MSSVENQVVLTAWVRFFLSLVFISRAFSSCFLLYFVLFLFLFTLLPFSFSLVSLLCFNFVKSSFPSFPLQFLTCNLLFSFLSFRSILSSQLLFLFSCPSLCTSNQEVKLLVRPDTGGPFYTSVEKL